MLCDSDVSNCVVVMVDSVFLAVVVLITPVDIAEVAVEDIFVGVEGVENTAVSVGTEVVVVAGIDVEEIAVDQFSVVVERLVMVVTAVEVVGGVDHIGAVVEAVEFVGVVVVKGKVVSLMVVAAVDGTAVSVIVVAFEIDGKGVITVVLIDVSGVVTVKFGVE